MSTQTETTCHYCSKTFMRPTNRYNEAIRNNWKQFCSTECSRLSKTTSVQCNCKQCGKPILRKPSSMHKGIFCSQSCAATYNNAAAPKRERTKKCVLCGEWILANRSYCPDCIKTCKAQQDINAKQLVINHDKGISRLPDSDGNYRTTYKCSICYRNLHINDFTVKKSGKVNSWCKTCNSSIVSTTRMKLKLLCLEYLNTTECSICGYDSNITALDFHHVDANAKEFGFAQYKRTTMTEELKTELNKCIVVCSNCHRELHNPSYTH